MSKLYSALGSDTTQLLERLRNSLDQIRAEYLDIPAQMEDDNTAFVMQWALNTLDLTVTQLDQAKHVIEAKSAIAGAFLGSGDD